MPTQREVEAIKQAHLASIAEVSGHYPPARVSFMAEEIGSVLISPFGPAPDGNGNSSYSHGVAAGPVSRPEDNPAGTAEYGLGYAMAALIAGLFFIARYLRKILE